MLLIGVNNFYDDTLTETMVIASKLIMNLMVIF